MEKEPRILRPANYPPPAPGKGERRRDRAGRGETRASSTSRAGSSWKPSTIRSGRPTRRSRNSGKTTPCIIVDFHAEATSEKVALGWYLDGRVSAVVGTHTHVPTADERILPGGTAYITDLGMAGARNSVIGIKREQAIQKFLTSRPIRFEPDKGGSFLSGVVVEIDPATGKALSIVREIHGRIIGDAP